MSSLQTLSGLFLFYKLSNKGPKGSYTWGGIIKCLERSCLGIFICILQTFKSFYCYIVRKLKDDLF